MALVTSQKMFERCKKDMGVTCDDPYCNDKADATTHSYINKDGKLACIVRLRVEGSKGNDGVDIAALLVHEAVHIWQQIRSTIVYEIDPKRTGGLEAEMEAYAIQNIASNLMQAYVDLVVSHE